jgi:flagellar protein FlaI
MAVLMATDEAGSSEPDVELPAGSDGTRAGPDQSDQVAVGEYTWDDFKSEFYFDDEGQAPDEPFAPEDHLGFDPASLEGKLAQGATDAEDVDDIVDERTVRVSEGLDEDAFFTTPEGATTTVNRYDLEKAVPHAKKSHFQEVERYWVNKPYTFIVIFHSEKENEKKYYVIEPYLNPIEEDLREFLSGKLKTAIKYSSDEVVVEGDEEARADVIERETRTLLRRYGLQADGDDPNAGGGLLDTVKESIGVEVETEDVEGPQDPSGIQARPEPAVLEEDSELLTGYQIEKILYLLKRDFIGYERIDGIKHDTVNVEDLGVDGYNMPVFVNHGSYEWMITNVYHGEEELDDFVVKMAQRSGKGISKRNPQVDATLPDGSRAQLTLGSEVSDHGTNYTIRQFKEVPLTPVDEINWKTLSLKETAFLWLCIENNKSMLIAGGTATGKTTLLNALSLFIPSNDKIVSIEDTREVELPQRNWIASVTRPSFGEGDSGDVDEFDLLEAALRQRPGYIVVGEVRGEEGQDLFQVMSTGHTSYGTFHADSVGEVIKRFTTDPINVSKTMFTALDLVAIQTRTRIGGNKVVRNKSLTEINHYDPENDEINVQDVYQWQAETDEFLKMGDSNTLETLMFDRGWSREEVEDELFKREIVLAHLIQNGLNTYTEVAATLQAFINDPESILALIANDELERSLEDLREMESVSIDIDPEKEEMVPRPDPDEEMLSQTHTILQEAEDLLAGYRGEEAPELAEQLDIEPASDVEATTDDDLGGFSFEEDL